MSLAASALTFSPALFASNGAHAGEIRIQPLVHHEAPSGRSAQTGVEAFGLLGSIEFKVGHADTLSKWTDLQQRVAREQASYAGCGADCAPRLRAWRGLMAELQTRPLAEQLERLNSFVNASARYASDAAAFGASDVWITPQRFFTGGVADCEDFAIVKLFSLLELGVDPDDIRLVVVRDVRRNIMHAVVAVAHGHDVLILDSLFDSVRPHETLLRYEPVYSLTTTKRYGHVVTADIRAQYVAAVMAQRYLVARN